MKLDKSKWVGCPIRYAAEIIADKWTLLIIRDLMFRGKSSYSSLLQSSENISTNILANRLTKLEGYELLDKIRDPNNGKQYIYELTEKGMDLIYTMLTLFEWSFKYDKQTYVSQKLINDIKENLEENVNRYKGGEILNFNSNET